MEIVGINIKKAREAKDMTLRELAQLLGVSASFISQVETGKASPSLATLKGIADALSTTVGVLLGDQETKPANPVVRAKERSLPKNTSKGMQIFLLTSPDPNKQMEPLLFRLDSQAKSGKSLYKHFGQEFVLVTKGALEIKLNDISYVLKQGDTIYFNSNIPHSFKNLHKGETEAVWVVTPPTF